MTLLVNPPAVHAYVPQADDVRACAECGAPCAPFPKRESPFCAPCWFASRMALARIQRARQARAEAR